MRFGRAALCACFAVALWAAAAPLRPAERQQPPVEEAIPIPDADPAEGDDVTDGEPSESEEPLAEAEAGASQPVDAAISEPEPGTGDAEAERQPSDFDERYLASQEGMADAAWWQVGITFVGMIVLIWNLIVARKASSAAIEAATAATNGLELSRRGYLFPQHIQIRRARANYRNGSPGEDVFMFGVVFKNVGVAPGKILRVVTSRRFVEPHVDPASIDWGFDVPETSWETTVGPSGEFIVSDIDLSVREAKRIFSKECRFFIRVRVEYKNMFESARSYHTEQGYEVVFGAEPENLYAAVPNLSDYILFRSYNPVSSAS